VTAQSGFQRIAKWVFVGCGVWLLGVGGYFVLARPPLLPEDLRYLGWSTAQAEALLPRLGPWLGNVFTVMGGFIAGVGILVILVGVHAIPRALPGTGPALACAGLLTVGTMSWINFQLDSDFKWMLLAPALAWLLGLATYASHKPRSDDRTER
jgi:hypothetical protein